MNYISYPGQTHQPNLDVLSFISPIPSRAGYNARIKFTGSSTEYWIFPGGSVESDDAMKKALEFINTKTNLNGSAKKNH